MAEQQMPPLMPPRILHGTIPPQADEWGEANNNDKEQNGEPVSGQHSKHKKPRVPTAMELLKKCDSQSGAHAILISSWTKARRKRLRSLASRPRAKQKHERLKTILKPRHEENKEHKDSKTNETKNQNINDNACCNSHETTRTSNIETSNTRGKSTKTFISNDSANNGVSKNPKKNSNNVTKDNAEIQGQKAKEGCNLLKFAAFSEDWGNDETLTLIFIYESDTLLVRGMALTGDVTKVDDTYNYKLLNYMRVDSAHVLTCEPTTATNVLFIEGWQEVFLLNGFGYGWMQSLRIQYKDQLSFCRLSGPVLLFTSHQLFLMFLDPKLQ